MQTTYNSTDVIEFANYVKWLEENDKKPAGEKVTPLDFEDWRLTKGLNKSLRETKLSVRNLSEVLLPSGFNHRKSVTTLTVTSFGGGMIGFQVQNVSEENIVTRKFKINERTLELRTIKE